MSEHHGTNGAGDDLAWGSLANCVGVDPDLFFPDRGGDTARAKALCRTCPVREACLQYALRSGQKYGIWGGMTPSQRRRLRRPVGLAVIEGGGGHVRVVSREGAHGEGRHLHLVGQD